MSSMRKIECVKRCLDKLTATAGFCTRLINQSVELTVYSLLEIGPANHSLNEDPRKDGLNHCKKLFWKRSIEPDFFMAMNNGGRRTENEPRLAVPSCHGRL